MSRTSPNITYDPGRPSGMVTWHCAKGVVVTYDLSLWREQYQAFHRDELVGSDIVATKSEPAAASVFWEYQRSRPVGDGILVIEQTALTIEHAPEPYAPIQTTLADMPGWASPYSQHQRKARSL